MKDQKTQAAKEAKRNEKRIVEEPARLAREQAIAEDQERYHVKRIFTFLLPLARIYYN